MKKVSILLLVIIFVSREAEAQTNVTEIAFTNADGSDDTDPYRMRKVRSSANNNWLELQLNDDADESFRIYGNSCVGFGCGAYSGNLYHTFDASGNVFHAGKVGIGTATPAFKLDVAGTTAAQGVRIPGRYSFGQSESALELEVPTNEYNAIRGFNGTQYLGTIHFFDDTWPQGHNSAGTINIEGISGFTIGSWNNPTAYFRKSDGNVGIGTTSPTQKLTVNGTIYGKEVKVDLNVPGPDYVFEKEYSLPTLESVKTYIEENKHLPEVPSAKEMEANGINLSEMNMILLKKVEELTLYMLEMKKENKDLRIRLEKIEKGRQ